MNNKNYHEVCLNNSQYDFLVIATSYENPVNSLLCDDYVPFLHNGKIVFDLTVINGKKFNRYASADVKDHKLVADSITVLSAIDDNIESHSKAFFAKNPDVIQNSVLPKALKFSLLNET